MLPKPFDSIALVWDLSCLVGWFQYFRNLSENVNINLMIVGDILCHFFLPAVEIIADQLFQMLNIPCVPSLQQGGFYMLPIMYPMLAPGLASAHNLEQVSRGPGIYAVPVSPYMGTVMGIPNTLIPFTYSTPTRSATSEAGEQGQVGQQLPQQAALHRKIVVRRFQIAFQLDLLLILKLAAVIFIFNQDGSRQRLAVLVFFSLIVYLYQTGAITPLMRWVSQAMHRAAAPPQPARPAAMVAWLSPLDKEMRISLLSPLVDNL